MSLSTHLPPWWKQRLLAVLGAPRNRQNLRFLEAQCRAEGGDAQWNPLNTTTHIIQDGVWWQEAEDYNSAKVSNFRKATLGVLATAATLLNGNYNGILGDLQAGKKTAEKMVADRRDEIKTWGTDPDLMLKVLKDLP
jgi:hypothetical protein